MLFKSKEKFKFDPSKDLRLQKVSYLYKGKVVKEESKVQYKNHDWDDAYWYDLRTDDRVVEINSEKGLETLGVEVPCE